MNLRACPFCGVTPCMERKPLWTTYNDGTTHGYHDCYEYDIRCRNPECGCTVKLVKNDTIYNTDDEARKNAIEAWNRRAIII